MSSVIYYRPVFRSPRAVSSVFRFYQSRSETTQGVICGEYQKEHRTGLQRGRQTVFVSTRDLRTCLINLKKMGRIVRKYIIRRVDNSGDLLIEYQDPESIRELHKHSRCFSSDQGIPVKTRHVFASGVSHGPPVDSSQIQIVKQPRPLADVIDDTLPLSLQIRQVYQEYRMSGYDKLARYFIASTVEEFVQHVLPASEIRLFGSSVNGLGRHNCDLDMTLNIRSDSIINQDSYKGPVYFRYLSKLKGEERNNSRTLLQLISLMVYAAYPCSHHVTSILSARVPILRFTHTGLSVTSDLSMNPIGPLMSEVLYKMGHIDERFVSLTFVIRIWARCWNVTQPSPGPWPTNFTITLLVLFYLQQHPSVMLPPVEKLVTVLGNEDDGYHYVAKHWQHIENTTSKNINLGELLKGFFDMYMTFDFEKHGVSVLTGAVIGKGFSEDPLLVENPLEPALNVSRNVNKAELDAFQKHCYNSLNLLEDGFKLQDLFRSAHDNSGSQAPDIKLSELFEMDDSEADGKMETKDVLTGEDAIGAVTVDRR